MVLCCATALLVLGGSTARAQEWSLEARGGQIRAASDLSDAVADSFLLGARYDHPVGGFRISTGVPTDPQSPVWGALGGWRRLMARRDSGFVYGADVAANGFLLRDRGARALSDPLPSATPGTSGYAGAGQVLPGLGYEGRRIQLHGRSGISQYRSRLGQDERNRTVWLSELQAVITRGSAVALVPAVRHYRDRVQGYTYSGVTGMAGHGRATMWASIGTWMAPFETGTPWAVGGSLRVHPRLALDAGARRDALDPLYGRAPHTSWNLGFTLRLTGRVAPPPPVPSAYRDGRATIRIPASAARSRPRIAGDFTEWQPQPMERDGNHWTYVAAVPPGVYHYAFVDDRDEWFVPEQTPGRRSDGMGGHVAVLVVAP